MIYHIDKGFVRLVDHLGTDLSFVNAARVSFGKAKEVFEESDAKLLHYLAQHEHTSPFRHAAIQFHFKMPEFVARQMYKHIVGSDYAFKDTAWNEISGRYVELTEMWQPTYLRKATKNKKQGSLDEQHEKSNRFLVEYDRVQEAAVALYKEMLDAGVAPEQARTILPVSFYTEFYWTASFQAVMHLIRLRTKPDAQQELRDYAEAVDEIATHLFPNARKEFHGSA